jgi:D-serine deaminase-like pyridoxal phosphate-dependent protein
MLTPLPETPFLVLNTSKVQYNATRMADRLRAAKVQLRPHVKTAKSLEVARVCHGGQTGPITVSTLKEAEFFAANGFTDILYAVGIAPNKFAHVARLRDEGVSLTIITDSLQAAHAIGHYCRDHAVHLPTLIEIDTDGHRAGVKPNDADTLRAIGQALDGNLHGVMTHAGASYECRSVAQIEAIAEQERSGIVLAANTLRGAGLPCAMVSLGSTPTAIFARSYAGITEVRAGVYIFQDLVMAGLGVCATTDIALSVACTVIGHRKDKGWLITDAGWMALSRDRGTATQAQDQAYGLVADEAGTILKDVLVSQVNQEHGVIAHRHGIELNEKDFPVGKLLRILPNHACATAAQFDRYHLETQDQSKLTLQGEWQRFSGW